MSTERTLMNGSYTIIGPGPGYCAYYTMSFEAQKGQNVTGLITSAEPSALVAYILSNVDYSNWKSSTQSICDPAITNIPIQWSSGPVYLKRINLNWTPPTDDEYWLLIEGFGSDNYVISINVTAPAIQTITTVMYSTSTKVTTFAMTQTLVSAEVEAVPQIAQLGNMLVPVVVIVMVIGIVAAAVFVRKKTSSRQPITGELGDGAHQ